ncbi:uncharacterized protein LOC131222619 isoform X3 [Magnolia sinica]|uniref:uncharacterized protein LOC131222619 isoform X3 n=1 Tax=Magnolia sinica TaxID=86752 RepID=UPI002659A695|nr:uncharacterized protein LOC131222619 isoform X3 [Magnolia sinica]
MVAVCIFRPPILNNRQRRFRCSSTGGQDKEDTPRLLKIAVSGVTELLRLLRSGSQTLNREDYTNNARDEPSVRRIDDVISILQSDYERAYFLTVEHGWILGKLICSQRLQGISLRQFMLKTAPLKIQRSNSVVRISTHGTWSCLYLSLTLHPLYYERLRRTYLKLPWRPLISIEGTTVYDLDDEFKIVRHVESWNVSAFEALIQIFTPGLRKDG